MSKPFFCTSIEDALSFGNNYLVASSDISPEIRRIAKPIQVERTLFGFHIPFLYDILASPHLAGQTDRERILEILERHIRFIAKLSEWKGMGFSLRYHSIPQTNEVNIALLARGIAQTGRGFELGEQMAGDIAALFKSIDVPIEPIKSEAELQETLEPFAQPSIVEIRQQEKVVPLQLDKHGAYVVYSFRPTFSTWIPLFKTLLEQRSPCALNIYLEPTQLSAIEHQLLAQAASYAEQLADFRFNGLAWQNVQIADPQARLVSQIYTNYLQRLSDPFLTLAQVLSPDPMTAFAVAKTLGAEITESEEIKSSGQFYMPSGFDLKIPRTPDEYESARRLSNALDLEFWGDSEATSGKERLRYLVDARGASAAFRFPIAINGGIPGVGVGSHKTPTVGDSIQIGTFTRQKGIVNIPTLSLTRHTLIAGTTGSGKTTTCFHILNELWERKIPFLVIEPQKTQYRSLLDSPIGSDLQIFTLGDESISPFRMNPLQILPGITVEHHISALRECLEAVLPTFGILHEIIDASLHAVYLNKGWNLTDRGVAGNTRVMPVLGELYYEFIRIAEELGHSAKTQQDIKGAAAGRLASLLRGSKGRMLNTRHSIPFETLMTRPTILELEYLNNEEKSLVMLFLLVHLREYVRTTRKSQQLAHVTVIEEAHRLASAPTHAVDREISSNSSASGAEALGNLLAEVRAYGEGIVIVEQSPSRLVGDALKNTNTKIIHRLTSKDEQDKIAGTLNLTTEQQKQLLTLPDGQAIFLTEKAERANLISIPNSWEKHTLQENISGVQVEEHMAQIRKKNPLVFLPFDGCRYCQKQCQYRDRVTPIAYKLEARKAFRNALHSFEQQKNRGDDLVAWRELGMACQQELAAGGLVADEHAVYCYFVHLWEGKISEVTAEKLRRSIGK